MPKFERDVEAFHMALRIIEADGIRFLRGEDGFLYHAVFPNGMTVPFGQTGVLGHYEDRVPAERGGRLASGSCHKDVTKRFLWRRWAKKQLTASDRVAYKQRYSSLWFEWQFLQ